MCFGVDGAVLVLLFAVLLLKLLNKLYGWLETECKPGVDPVLTAIGVEVEELLLEIPFSKLSSKNYNKNYIID
jgi:hypothetical protein